MRILTVSEFMNYLQNILRTTPILNQVRLEGEICNLYRNKNRGFNYFSLKDDKAMVSCVDFRNLLPSSAKDGDLVQVLASSRLHLSRGSYQLEIQKVESSGRGKQLEELEKLKKKLAAEGLFDRERKKALPFLPIKIGLITSRDGAVLHDFANELNKRYPMARVILSASSVQGQGADLQMIGALKKLEEIDKTDKIDIIVIARGGGSQEDLDAFNSEALARAVSACQIPIVSAIGHQVDNSILDMVADHRSSTPTQAATEIIRDFTNLYQDIEAYIGSIKRSYQAIINDRQIVLFRSLRKLEGLRPDRKILLKFSELDKKLVDLDNKWQNFTRLKKDKLDLTLSLMAKKIEEKLRETSWLIEDIDGKSLYGGELLLGEKYNLISNNYKYLIEVKEKEKILERDQ